MIAERLEFEWGITGDGEVRFSVKQNPLHALCERWYSRGVIPPINERAKYLEQSGLFPRKKIKAMVKNHIQAKKNSEKEQKVIDGIFEKFNIKPKKKKVLKAVKKK